MKSLGGVSRRELYERVDRPALRPLPTDRFEPAEWSRARVHEDYHVDVGRHWYSVPFELIGQEVEIRRPELQKRATRIHRTATPTGASAFLFRAPTNGTRR